MHRIKQDDDKNDFIVSPARKGANAIRRAA
jgi:hypothetical protein